MGALFGSIPDDPLPPAPPEADPAAEEAKARKESLERRRRGIPNAVLDKLCQEAGQSVRLIRPVHCEPRLLHGEPPIRRKGWPFAPGCFAPDSHRRVGVPHELEERHGEVR